MSPPLMTPKKKIKKEPALIFHQLHAAFLLGLFFNHENEGNMFLRNIDLF
jgi:hypothetical protein